jgi:ribosomal protein L22
MSLRQAAQQALEALEQIAKYENPQTKIQARKKDGSSIVTMYPHKVASDAAQALRTALAEPERKPLTDEEIALIVGECAASAHRHDDFSFARAIERAHGIGGEA